MSDTGQHDAYALRDRMPDDHIHGNHLRVPDFGILDLRLKAGGKESKFFLPVNARKTPKHLTGEEDFHFAPVKETIELRYTIDDPFRVVTAGTLDVLTRFEDQPLWSLDLGLLGTSWLLPGEHIVQWDGRIVKPVGTPGTIAGETITHDLTSLEVHADKDGPFPGGYVSLEKPPYRLRLSLSSNALKAYPAHAWTYFHILIKKIELELGPEAMVPKWGDDARLARDRQTRKAVEDDGGLPADGGIRKVFLRSNLYKSGSAEMNDNTGFTQYQSMWAGGPSLPILAKIRIADSADAEVKLEEAEHGRVLGRARFLWDWEDADESLAGQQAAPSAFIAAAANYYKGGTDATRAAQDHTYPKGDNCHVDRGGKRGPGATGVFSTPDGYEPQASLKPHDFPFKTDRCTTRRWAAYSQGWNTGLLKGKTGVLFRGSRMAGDDFKLSCYLDYDRSARHVSVLDVKDEPLLAPDPVKAVTGKFQIWRRVQAVRYIRKTAAVADWTGNFAAAQAYYAQAYVDLADAMGGSKYLLSAHRKADGTAPDYNALAEAALLAAGRASFNNHLAQDAAADHAADDAVFRLRPYVDFVRRVHELVNGNPGDAIPDAFARGLGIVDTATIADVALRGRVLATKNWLTTGSMETQTKWSNRLGDMTIGPMEKLVGDLQTLSGGNGGAALTQGIAIIHFTYVHSGVAEAVTAGLGVSVTNGVAIDVADATRNRCTFVFTNPRTDTFVHEIGHHMFLPHARYPLASPPGGAQVDRHDDDDTLCTMSYNRPRTYFCGLCQLRLRGWSATPLSKIDANNTKP